MTKQSIRIGGASGFWGDTAIAVPQLIGKGKLDFLVFDYLAEITMSIMARARKADPEMGYAHDFVSTLGRVLGDISRQKIKVISNAGGVNPLACAKALEKVIAEKELNLKVAVVLGDDLIERADEFRARGTTEMASGAALPDELMSMNAYLGAFPIADALNAGADIVITGRVVDSAVTLGACIHTFGWHREEFDKLAAASLAGHIIECGAQSTGGIHTDWEATGDWANIGFPVAEVSVDGSFTLSKPEDTGGLVSYATVAEQLLYEIGDPRAYLLPDVSCDFTDVHIEETGSNLVRVSGAKGHPPTDSYKVSATYQDGWRIGMYITIAGLDAVRKAEAMSEAVLRRCSGLFKALNLPPFIETSVELIGAEACYGAASQARDTREVILKLAAKHENPKALNMFIREATSGATAMAPGMSGMGGNRPKPSPVVRLFSCLVPKSDLNLSINVAGQSSDTPGAMEGGFTPPPSPQVATIDEDTSTLGETSHSVPLIHLAWGRSGDKGNHANIGIIARRADYLPYIRAALSEEKVAHTFAHYFEPNGQNIDAGSLAGRVQRYEVPGLNALNFLLLDVLGGGGIASLYNDPQGKAFAQILLSTDIPVTEAIAKEVS